MPPPLAALLCVIFIAYLFWSDRGEKTGVSSAIWVPFFWMFFAAGRTLAEWFNLGPPAGSVNSYVEGNPVNAATFFLLIAAGVLVLSRREIDWRGFFAKNKLFLFYLLYCLISILWSDYPFVSFKRWIKEFGSLVMVLVILTEEIPYEALGTLVRRLGFLWLPLSCLFVKYYPDLGRAYAPEGAPMYTGIATQKNGLGQLCLISAIFYGWHYVLARKPDFRFRSRENVIDLLLIALLVWLFHLSQSATSFTCALVALLLFTACRVTADKPGRVMTWAIVAVLLFFALDSAVDLNAAVIHLLGRKQNLTGRTQIWALVRSMVVSPWLGAGYQDFWMGRRLQTIWSKIGMDIVQAHDGYLEQYLELGYIGVGFIICIIIAGLVKARRLMDSYYAAGALTLCLIIVATLYNYTEASFAAINNIWFLLVLAVIELPEQWWTVDGAQPPYNRSSVSQWAFRDGWTTVLDRHQGAPTDGK
jgi:hypothetical protein